MDWGFSSGRLELIFLNLTKGVKRFSSKGDEMNGDGLGD